MTSTTLRISLKPGEKIFVNGAVLRVDRKTSLEFLNDVTFLLESHVIQPEEATTPLRQLYFIVQMMLIEPAAAGQARRMFEKSVALLLECFEDERMRNEVMAIEQMIARERHFEALKAIRTLYPREDEILERPDIPAGELAHMQREFASWQ
ncbi:flagellar biosynthesis repressor FlbT [Pararhizobium mangrovi]|uniref:Probable flagellum biosynthesis repressor protein FlbT n=1 Tax=Pararhizobium mangrovi TaxID=2590452 RepID=A0A506U1Q7_9HYPH|nr:flagellar biosynthesis repressor FlbT [Pararhizobium mangrovi]TPW26905.1 flagellar biosynthesis repressor FlbT [Pararhizobium mangrovi]